MCLHCTPTFPMMKGLMHAPKLLAESGHASPPITDIVTLKNHVLTKNNITFLDKHYLQVHGTIWSMACPFMGKLEECMLASAPCWPWMWWRYIDDIFFIWTSDEESLTRFIDHMNYSFHRTIKFTSEYSATKPHFLDVDIRKEENGLTNYWSICQTHR